VYFVGVKKRTGNGRLRSICVIIPLLTGIIIRRQIIQQSVAKNAAAYGGLRGNMSVICQGRRRGIFREGKPLAIKMNLNDIFTETKNVAKICSCGILNARLWAQKNGVAFVSANKGKKYLWSKEDIKEFKRRKKTPGRLARKDTEPEKFTGRAFRNSKLLGQFKETEAVANTCRCSLRTAQEWAAINGVGFVSSGHGRRYLWSKNDIALFDKRKKKPGPRKNAQEKVENET
jgi:hypothetical protein